VQPVCATARCATTGQRYSGQCSQWKRASQRRPARKLLRSHTPTPRPRRRRARQVLDAYELRGQSIVGLKITSDAEVGHFGRVARIWQTEKATLSITEFVEKRSLEYAQTHLAVDRIENGHFLVGGQVKCSHPWTGQMQPVS